MRTGFKWLIAILILTVIGLAVVPAVYGWFHMM